MRFFCKIHHSIAVVQEDTVGQDEKCRRSLFDDYCECTVEVFCLLHRQGQQLDMHGLCCAVRLRHGLGIERVVGVQEHRDVRKVGYDLSEHPQPLAFQLYRHRAQSGDIAARARHAG